jgi:adenylate kinase
MADRGGIDTALYIKVSQKELVRRLSDRLVCADCQTPHNGQAHGSAGSCIRCGGKLYQRDDDKPEAVEKRNQVYLEETAPLVEHYRKAGILVEVEGERTVEEVGRDLVALIDPRQMQS